MTSKGRFKCKSGLSACHNHECMCAKVCECAQGINSKEYSNNNMAVDCSTPQSHAIKDVSSELLKVGVSGVRVCHLDSSTATIDVKVVSGSRVLCHLDSLVNTVNLMSGRYI